MLLLTAITVATGASRALSVIAVGPVFDEIDHQKQCKDHYRGGQYENYFRHFNPYITLSK
jgi:hypothetical protein